MRSVNSALNTGSASVWNPHPRAANSLKGVTAKYWRLLGSTRSMRSPEADGELGRLFAHVGVATDWVPELIEVIDSRRLDGSAAGSLSTEVEALVEILAEQPRQVGSLCQTLPETAATLLRPIVATVRYAADNPDGWEYALQAEEVEGRSSRR